MASAAFLSPPAAVHAGLPLSVETAPHYIGFNDQDIADGNSLLKCAPPIRDKANQEGLFQGLKVRHQNPSAVMHLIASDTSCTYVLYYHIIGLVGLETVIVFCRVQKQYSNYSCSAEAHLLYKLL